MKRSLTILAATVLAGSLSLPALAQEDYREHPNPPANSGSTYRGDHDTTRAELRSFDEFADQHRDIENDLRTNPSLINDPEYLEHHSELREYLEHHPKVAEEFKENPTAFENRMERREAKEHHHRHRHYRHRDYDNNNTPS